MHPTPTGTYFDVKKFAIIEILLLIFLFDYFSFFRPHTFCSVQGQTLYHCLMSYSIHSFYQSCHPYLVGFYYVILKRLSYYYIHITYAESKKCPLQGIKLRTFQILPISLIRSSLCFSFFEK